VFFSHVYDAGSYQDFHGNILTRGMALHSDLAIFVIGRVLSNHRGRHKLSPQSSPVRGQGSAKTRGNQCVISHITKMRPSALSWMTPPRHLRRRTARRRNRALWPPRFRQKMLSSLPSSIPEMGVILKLPMKGAVPYRHCTVAGWS
jgi:hypothetical protein